MTGKTAFVTGASGFIGVNLVKQLGEAGWSVIAMHRETSDLTYLRQFPASRVVGDIGDREFLAGAIPEGVDAVFHVAGNVSFDSAGDEAQTHANVAGTHAVVEVAKARNVGRFIHTSTGAVFGLHDGVPIDETAPSNADEIPVNYCRTKKAAEDIVLEAAAAGLDAVCVNPGNVVGPYDRVIWGPLVQAIASGAMTTVGSGGGAFCHIDETAKAHIAAFERGRRGERYILAGANESFSAAARIVAELVGVEAPVPTRARNPDASDEIHFVTNQTQIMLCDKAVRELGFKPVPLRTMFADLCAWMQAEGLLPAA
jgi:nucleoside-diphosphate-sugar epimerase